MLHLSNASHAVNHFQNQMMTMLYPSIMAEMGLSYTAVGALAAVCSMLNSICQGVYGLLTPFASRCKLLGVGNLGIALGTLMSGLAGSYPTLIVARGVASIGSSAQHPVGYSILATAPSPRPVEPRPRPSSPMPPPTRIAMRPSACTSCSASSPSRSGCC
jgi:MFS family permease